MKSVKFTHLNKPKLLSLKTVEENGKRHYILPSGRIVPSVTTVLSQYKEKSLKEWKAKVGEEKSKKIAKVAADRGTGLHKIIEKYLENDSGYNKDCMPDSFEMFISLKPFLNDINNIAYQEAQLYSEALEIAGRTDTIAEYKGVPAIIDFKQSNRPKKEEWIDNYAMQGTIYSMCYAEMFGEFIPNIVIMIGVKDSIPQIFHFKVKDYMKKAIAVIRTYKSKI